MGAVGNLVIAEQIKAQLVDRCVDNILCIGSAALVRCHALRNRGNAQSKELHDRTHPFGVAGGKIVIDGDNMDAFASQRETRSRHGTHQSFAFAGGHLDDVSGKQAQHGLGLHIEGMHP